MICLTYSSRNYTSSVVWDTYLLRTDHAYPSDHHVETCRTDPIVLYSALFATPSRYIDRDDRGRVYRSFRSWPRGNYCLVADADDADIFLKMIRMVLWSVQQWSELSNVWTVTFPRGFRWETHAPRMGWSEGKIPRSTPQGSICMRGLLNYLVTSKQACSSQYN